MMIDLDRFKQVNDTLGHPVGDRLLAQVSKRLQTLMGQPNELCGRLGGDEFAVVLRDASDSARTCGQPRPIDHHLAYRGLMRWTNTLFISGPVSAAPSAPATGEASKC